MPRKKKEYSPGMVFQKLTLIEEDFEHDRKQNYARFFLCKCVCGNIKSIGISALKSGGTISCGCHRILNGKKNKTHGMFGTKFYACWSGMKDRCYNKKTKAYKNYGGRGISVCDKWLKFDGFYEDMYGSYDSKLTIERIDNEKGYSKENCKWIPKGEQNLNKRGVIKYEGKCIAERARIRGMKPSTISKRYLLYGFSLHDAIFNELKR